MSCKTYVNFANSHLLKSTYLRFAEFEKHCCQVPENVVFRDWKRSFFPPTLFCLSCKFWLGVSPYEKCICVQARITPFHLLSLRQLSHPPAVLMLCMYLCAQLEEMRKTTPPCLPSGWILGGLASCMVDSYLADLVGLASFLVGKHRNTCFFSMGTLMHIIVANFSAVCR